MVMMMQMVMQIVMIVVNGDGDCDADGDDDGVGDDDDCDGADGCHLSRGLLGLCCLVEAGFSPSPPPWEGGGFATKIRGRGALWSAMYLPSSKGLSESRGIAREV